MLTYGTSCTHHAYSEYLNLIHMYSVALPFHNNSIQYCGFQQWRSDKTLALTRLLLQLKNTLFQLRLFNTPPTPSPSGCGSCDGRAETGWGRASNGPAKPTRVSSYSLSFSQSGSKSFSTSLQKDICLSSPPTSTPSPLKKKTVTGFNHLSVRMFTSGERQHCDVTHSRHAHTHTYAVGPMHIPPPVFPKYTHAKDTGRERGSGSLEDILTLTLSACCWWI